MRNETKRVRGWVGSMYVADSLFYIWGHGHHCQFLNRTDSEGALRGGFGWLEQEAGRGPCVGEQESMGAAVKNWADAWARFVGGTWWAGPDVHQLPPFVQTFCFLNLWQNLVTSFSPTYYLQIRHFFS